MRATPLAGARKLAIDDEVQSHNHIQLKTTLNQHTRLAHNAATDSAVS